MLNLAEHGVPRPYLAFPVVCLPAHEVRSATTSTAATRRGKTQKSQDTHIHTRRDSRQAYGTNLRISRSGGSMGPAPGRIAS